MNRKNLFQFGLPLFFAIGFFLFFKPRFDEVLAIHYLEHGLINLLFVAVLDVIFFYVVFGKIERLFEAIFTDKPKEFILYELIITASLSFGLIVNFLLRIGYSSANLVRLEPDISAFSYLFPVWAISLIITVIAFSLFDMLLESYTDFFLSLFPKNEQTSEIKITKEIARTYTDIEKEHDSQQVQVRLQKATELYHTLQTDEGREEAKSIIDDMQQEIDHFNKQLKQGEDKGVLTEIKMQKRMNDALIRSNSSSPIK